MQALHPKSLLVFLRGGDDWTLRGGGARRLCRRRGATCQRRTAQLMELMRRGRPVLIDPAQLGARRTRGARFAAAGARGAGAAGRPIGPDGRPAGARAAAVGRAVFRRRRRRCWRRSARRRDWRSRTSGWPRRWPRGSRSSGARGTSWRSRATCRRSCCRRIGRRARPLDYAGACLQARVVGGDFFDFVSVQPAPRSALVLADISGKGISAALLMASLQANLRALYAQAPHDLARLLERVNQIVLRLDGVEPLRDAVLRALRRRDARLTTPTAATCRRVLLRADGSVERLGVTAAVIGLFTPWECATSDASPGRRRHARGLHRRRERSDVGRGRGVRRGATARRPPRAPGRPAPCAARGHRRRSRRPQRRRAVRRPDADRRAGDVGDSPRLNSAGTVPREGTMSERLSVFDMFKVSVGPSSSHTLGPWRAALAFVAELDASARPATRRQPPGRSLRSLAKTGHGHGTDLAVQAGLLGLDPETCDVVRSAEDRSPDRRDASDRYRWPGRDRLPARPATSGFTRCNSCRSIRTPSRSARTSSREKRVPARGTRLAAASSCAMATTPSTSGAVKLPYPIDTAADLLKWCDKTGWPVSRVVWENERAWRPAAATARWPAPDLARDGGLHLPRLPLAGRASRRPRRPSPRTGSEPQPAGRPGHGWHRLRAVDRDDAHRWRHLQIHPRLR